MKKKRFSIEQIVAVLKQAELGMPVADLIRQVGSRNRRSTAGRSSTQGCSRIRCESSSSCRKTEAIH